MVQKKSRRGIARLISAFRYSMMGFKACYQHEIAFRHDLGITLTGLVLSFILLENPVYILLVNLLGFLLLMVELLNSAIEALADRFGNEWTDLAGRAKDMGSAAVFIALTMFLTAWVVCLWQTYKPISLLFG